jgi:hypothetical protein
MAIRPNNCLGGVVNDPTYDGAVRSGDFLEIGSGWGSNIPARSLPSPSTSEVPYEHVARNYNGIQTDTSFDKVNRGSVLSHTGYVLDTVYSDGSTANPDIKSAIIENQEIMVNAELAQDSITTAPQENSSGDYGTVQIEPFISSPNVVAQYYLVGVTNVESGENLVISGADVDTNTLPKLIKELTNNEGDYTKLVGREDWATGRYLKEEVTKNSILTHLCKTAQILGYTNRMGQIAFNTFREYNQEVIPTHDGDIILNDSIKNAKTSSVDKIYNSFNVRWATDFTTDKPTKFIKIGNIKEDAFPVEGVDFRSYVDGVESYSLAKSYWDMAKAAYDTTTTVNKAPDGLTNCLYGVFSTNDSEGASYGYYTLVGLLEWNTKTKLTIPYKLPITSDTIKLEVGGKTIFNDFLASNGNDYEGWVTGVSVNTTTDELDISFTYVADEQEGIDEIIETSYNEDEIIEDEANVDEIIEQ